MHRICAAAELPFEHGQKTGGSLGCPQGQLWARSKRRLSRETTEREPGGTRSVCCRTSSPSSFPSAPAALLLSVLHGPYSYLPSLTLAEDMAEVMASEEDPAHQSRILLSRECADEEPGCSEGGWKEAVTDGGLAHITSSRGFGGSAEIKSSRLDFSRA